MPEKDLMTLVTNLNKYSNDQINWDGERILSKQKCDTFELENFTLKIAGLYYRIP